MADVRISALPTAQSPITGAELVPIVQNGLTVQTTVSAITQSPSLTQTFLTVGQQTGLPNSRYFSTGTGLGFTDGGAQGPYTIALNGSSGSLEGAGTGVIVKSAANTIVARSLVSSGNGLGVTNGDGIAGNPTFALTGLAQAIANASGTGLLALNGSSTISPVTITGTGNQIGVTGGDGSSTPTISLAANFVAPGTAGITLPNGTTAQRGATTGQIRYNTTTARFEGYYAGSWQTFGIGDGSVTSVSGTTNQISVSNVGSIATVAIATDPTIPGTGGVVVPVGTTAQRPASPTNGTIRYSTTLSQFEAYLNGAWSVLSTASTGVTSIATGTGLTGGPITTTGTISIANTAVTAAAYGSASSVAAFTVNAQGQLTLASSTSIAISASQVTSGTLAVAQGGTGVGTLSGLAYGNGTSAFTAATGAQIATAIGTTAVTNSTNTTNLLGGANGSLPYQTGSGATTFLAAGTNGYVLTLAAGVPTWAASTGGVTSFSAGTTGLTPSSATTGAISLAGTLVVGNGGTGAATLTGYVYGNGTSAMTASTTIPNTAITGLGTMSTQNANAVVITGGTINGTSVGATTRSTGDFTSLSGNTVTSTTPVLSFNAANTIASFGTTSAGSYNQLIIQNQSNSAGASTNYVVSNNLGTDSTYYGEFGMNSSTFSASTPTDFYGINNGIYYSGHDGDISVGSGNGFKTYLTWGTAGQSSHVINASGAIGLSTNLGTTPALSGTTGFGTSGQVLQSNGAAAAPTWVTPAGGVTLSNDTATSTNVYPVFASATSGSVSTVYTGNANLLYKPSTGELQAQVLTSINGLTVNNATVNTSYTIPTGYNAISAGPITVASGIVVTVPSGSVWVIA